VENAFVHGFKGAEKPHVLSLSGKRTKKGVIIRVEDNGSGMTKDALTRIREVIRKEGPATHGGLVMSCAKLRMFYDAPVAFRIKSAQREGTTVELTLPFEGGESG
jgi:two-component system sensor histidine kinase YesM